tara:strand:- start:633 stop:776 length:144 start_codon:yes stop_codon:yes gene_type:complete
MPNYRLIYVPLGREDKEWIDIYATTNADAVKQSHAISDTIISLNPIK